MLASGVHVKNACYNLFHTVPTNEERVAVDVGYATYVIATESSCRDGFG